MVEETRVKVKYTAFKSLHNLKYRSIICKMYCTQLLYTSGYIKCLDNMIIFNPSNITEVLDGLKANTLYGVGLNFH